MSALQQLDREATRAHYAKRGAFYRADLDIGVVPSQPYCEEIMTHSLGNVPRTFRSDPRANISRAKCGNQDWVADQAKRITEKEGGELTGMTPKAFANLRQGRNKISFDNLVEWCRNDPSFAAAFAEYVGLIRPGEAEFAGALTAAFNAYQRRAP